MNRKKRIDWEDIFSLPSIIYTVSGVVISVIALKGFLISNRFMDGGVTSMSIILSEIAGIEFSISFVLLNLVFIYFGYYKIGKTFAIHSLIAIILLGVLTEVLNIPVVTEDKILIAFFGGFLMGLGVGLVIRAGAIIDGLEVIADYTNKKYGLSTSEIVLFTNSVIMIIAAYYFGPETAMYSILTYFTASKTSDYVVDGFEEYTALTIISQDYENVKSIIVNDFNKAISVYKGERGYLPDSFDVVHDCDIVMTIVTRLEIHRIKEAISEADPNAFFYIHSINEVMGGVIKQKVKF
ncbi:MAG: YitT family protein [Saprospiraceae bacterium]